MAHELEYVVDNALLECSEGTVPMFFHPTPRNIRIQGMKVANASDKTPITNIPSFVICQKLTKAAGGIPVPCVPVTSTQTWQDTYPVKINGEKLLVYRCSIRCTSGQGKISFMTSGQTPVGAAGLAQLQQLQQEAEEALKAAEAEANSVGESGLVEGMIPVWGSGRDLIHAVQTGNGWGMALNAGFLVWDVASVAAGVVSFGTATVAMQGAKAGARGLIKAGVKVASRGLAEKVAQLTAKALLAKGALKKAMLHLASGRVCVIACFPAGTLVAVEEGHKPIEELEAGERVWSRDEETGELALQPVVTTMSRQSDHLLHLRLGGERISTTVEHPFWVDRRGWVKAGELVLGDLILRADDAAVAVTQIEHQTEFADDQLPIVYNIEVGEWHNYLVGKWMWWVHNAGPCSNLWRVGSYEAMRGIEAGLDAHHVGQKALMSKFIPGYDLLTAPTILVPKIGHTIRGPNGIVSRSMNGFDNARQVLARDIRELRRVYPDIPNSALQELIEMNKRMYPVINTR